MEKQTGIVSVIRRSRDLIHDAPIVDWTKEVLSVNRITGASLNFPIYQTCNPTEVCARLCYASSGAISWPRALSKQVNNLLRCKQNPKRFGDLLIQEVRKRKLNYLRWNGVGDLFPEAIECLDYVASELAEVQFWVVTRKHDLAKTIKTKSNVFLHHSLDRTTLSKIEDIKFTNKNSFFSYQCDKGEIPDPLKTRKVSVIFFDDYKPTTPLSGFKKEQICPLNYEDEKINLCSRCRRCFDGSAVDYLKKTK